MVKILKSRSTKLFLQGCTICPEMVVVCGPCVSWRRELEALTVGPGTLGKGTPEDQTTSKNMISDTTSTIAMIYIIRSA
jgi:hypothetical protein